MHERELVNPRYGLGRCRKESFYNTNALVINQIIPDALDVHRKLTFRKAYLCRIVDTGRIRQTLKGIEQVTVPASLCFADKLGRSSLENSYLGDTAFYFRRSFDGTIQI